MVEAELRSSSTRRLNWRAALDVIATIVMVIAAGVVIWTALAKQDAAAPARPPLPVPTEPLALDSVPTLGSQRARVAMLIFSDFECPFCARLAVEVMPVLKREYADTGKARFAFRHLPLPAHSRATRAAESAECARRQGRFWAMHDSLFEPPMRLGEPELATHARKAGLDLGEFDRCMTGAAASHVAADLSIAQDLGLMVTPTVIIGVVGEDGTVQALEVITGARPAKEFRSALDRALARVGEL
jgi:protein-disulfide isomerase